MSKAKQQFNTTQKALRARVEEPVGIIQFIFPILKHPWREKDVAFDNVVLFAAGLYNTKYC